LVSPHIKIISTLSQQNQTKSFIRRSPNHHRKSSAASISLSAPGQTSNIRFQKLTLPYQDRAIVFQFFCTNYFSTCLSRSQMAPTQNSSSHKEGGKFKILMSTPSIGLLSACWESADDIPHLDRMTQQVPHSYIWAPVTKTSSLRSPPMLFPFGLRWCTKELIYTGTCPDDSGSAFESRISLDLRMTLSKGQTRPARLRCNLGCSCRWGPSSCHQNIPQHSAQPHWFARNGVAALKKNEG
jgi:hypothetical protein